MMTGGTPRFLFPSVGLGCGAALLAGEPYIILPPRHEVLPCKKRLRVRLIRCYISARCPCSVRSRINLAENRETFENVNEMLFSAH